MSRQTERARLRAFRQTRSQAEQIADLERAVRLAGSRGDLWRRRALAWRALAVFFALGLLAGALQALLVALREVWR